MDRLALALISFLAAGCLTSDLKFDVDEPGYTQLPPRESPTGATNESRNNNPAHPNSPIGFAADLESAWAGEFSSEFPLYDQRSIFAAVTMVDTPGVRFGHLDLHLESGSLYASYWRAFSTDPDAPDQAPHPSSGLIMPVDHTTAVRGATTLHIAIPVAGTRLTRYGLDGTISGEFTLGADNPREVASGQFDLVVD